MSAVTFAGPRNTRHTVDVDPTRARWASVDPSVDAMGLAIFDASARLLVAGMVPIERAAWEPSVVNALRSLGMMANWRAFDLEVAVERPVVLPPRAAKRRSRPVDVVTLALVAGGAAATIGRLVRAEEPHAWKGSTDADAFVEIVKTRWVDEVERTRVVPTSPSVEHNVWDAVGIGVHYLRGRGLRR